LATKIKGVIVPGFEAPICEGRLRDSIGNHHPSAGATIEGADEGLRGSDKGLITSASERQAQGNYSDTRNPRSDKGRWYGDVGHIRYKDFGEAICHLPYFQEIKKFGRSQLQKE